MTFTVNQEMNLKDHKHLHPYTLLIDALWIILVKLIEGIWVSCFNL